MDKLISQSTGLLSYFFQKEELSNQNLVEFPVFEMHSPSEGLSSAKILEDSETDFTHLRILNRYFSCWESNCLLRVGERLIEADSRFLSKLSPLLATMVAAAEAAEGAETVIDFSDDFSEISPETMEFLISFLSGEIDLPDLWQGRDLKIFQEIVSFAVRWQSPALLAFCDTHAVSCLTQCRSARDSVASAVSTLTRWAAAVPILCRLVPSKLYKYKDLLSKDNLKLAFWATCPERRVRKLLSALPNFQRTIAESGSSIVSNLWQKDIRVIPTSSNLWPFLNREDSSLENVDFLLSRGEIGEPQRDKERQYLHCAQRVLNGEPISQVLKAQEETFLMGLLLHSIRQAPLNYDFASLTSTLVCYLRDLVIEGRLSRPSAFLLAHLANQNPVHALLLREKKLVFEAQQTAFTSLRSYLNEVDISDEDTWSLELLTERARAASDWTAADWEELPLVCHWQLFCTLMDQDRVSFGTIEKCHQLLKQRLKVAISEDECPKWAQHAHKQLSSVLTVLVWQGEVEQICDSVEVIEDCKTVEISLFHVLSNGTYVSKLRECEPQICIRCTSQNLDQLPILTHLLETGALPKDIVLSELDWSSLVADLGFLDAHKLISRLETLLSKRVNLDNVAEYFDFARKNELLALQMACIDVLNRGGFVKIIPHETRPWELKELAGIDRMPLGQKEMLFNLLRDNEWSTSIKTWSSKMKALDEKAIFRNKTVQNVAEGVSALSIALTSFIGSIVGVGYLGDYLCNFAAVVDESVCDDLKFISCVGAAALSLGAIISAPKIALELSVYLANRIVPLTPSQRSKNLRIRGPELQQLSKVSAPEFASNLAYAIDERTQVLDLTHCSNQLTPQDIAWIAQSCPQLSELRLGITKHIYGEDWKPLAKLSKLCKFVLVFSSSRLSDFNFISTLNLRELAWPDLKEIQVILQDRLPDSKRDGRKVSSLVERRADLSFFDNCPAEVPLELTVKRNFWGDISQVFSKCHNLRVLDFDLESLSTTAASTISQHCTQLSHLIGVRIESWDLLELATHCNLTQIVSCVSFNLSDEDVQQLVHLRGSRLQKVSGYFPQVTSLGANSFASCPNLEHLVLGGISIVEGAIESLLSAPQIRHLSFIGREGISLKTQRRLAGRWLENLCPHAVEQLWSDLGSAISSGNTAEEYNRLLPPLIAFSSQVKGWEALAKIFQDGILRRESEPTNASIEMPFGLLLSLAPVIQNLMVRGPKANNLSVAFMRELFDLTGGDPFVLIQLISQRLASSKSVPGLPIALPAFREEVLTSYLRYLSLSNHTFTVEQMNALNRQWNRRAKEILKECAEEIRSEIFHFLTSTVFERRDWAVELVSGGVLELFPMTIACAKKLKNALLDSVDSTLASNSRLPRARRKLLESVAKAQQELGEFEGAVEGLRQRRRERLEGLREADGTLAQEHQRQALESEQVEEHMLETSRDRIREFQEKLDALPVDSNVDDDFTALLIGMFLQPEFWTLVNETLTDMLSLSEIG